MQEDKQLNRQKFTFGDIRAQTHKPRNTKHNQRHHARNEQTGAHKHLNTT